MANKDSSVSLDDLSIEFAERKVASGEFRSISEVVCEAMRRYIAEDAKLVSLRREIQKGLDSGIAEDFDFDRFVEETFGAE